MDISYNERCKTVRKRHKCKVFHCDYCKDRYCCFYCNRKEKCRNHCLNNPNKCGNAFEQ